MTSSESCGITEPWGGGWSQTRLLCTPEPVLWTALSFSFPFLLCRGSSSSPHWHFSFPSRKRPEIRICIIGKLNCYSLLFTPARSGVKSNQLALLCLSSYLPTENHLTHERFLWIISYIPLWYFLLLLRPAAKLFLRSFIILLNALNTLMIWPQ